MAEERKPCPNFASNNSYCTCPKNECPRHGVCCLCVQNHINNGSLPQCFGKAGMHLQS